MNLAEVMIELEALGNAQTRKIFQNHGADLDMFGVKVADLKILMKKLKKNHSLALELYDTGNADAMYLAGLIADPKKVSIQELQDWVEKARWYMVGEYMVAGLAAESPHGWELGLEWIDREEDHIAAIGWATLSGVISLREDSQLDQTALAGLLARAQAQIHQAGNRTRYCMNSFVISLGAYVAPLTQKAIEAARKIGKVAVDMGGTACKVPSAPEYIEKIAGMGRIGKKKKKVRC